MKMVLTIMACLSVAFARDHNFDINSDDGGGSSIWDGFDDMEAPYEHPWADIPDLIDMNKWGFRFNLTHHFLTGVERGVYMDNTITLNNHCFGDIYVTKLNELYAMQLSNPIKNAIPMVALVYQFYYMIGDQCSFDKVLNDFFVFCWNQGCYPSELIFNGEMNVFFMFRSVIDSGIVFKEGVPENTSVDIAQWNNLARQTGETFAQILKEFTNFEIQTAFDA